MRMTPRSSSKGVVWPALVSGRAAALLATLQQMEQSQWWPAEEIEAHQRRQLAALLRHARAHVPFHRARIEAAGLTGRDVPTMEQFRRLPLLTRDDIRAHKRELTSQHVPAEHGPTYEARTSGSSGTPLDVTVTELGAHFWRAVAQRDDLWHERDARGRFVVIRSGRHERDPLAVRDLPTWGPGSSDLYDTGPMTMFYHTAPLARQVEILESRSPRYLLTYPENARQLTMFAKKSRVRLPELLAVHTYGEPLTQGVRAACGATWGVPVQDVYSCEEVGFIALQCPEHEHYHVQSETVLVEVLDEAGNPCRPGQIGSVVLTPLHAFAMPLLRYSIEDLAEVGERCPCGRGLPVITKIHGRRENQVTLPDGERIWPDVDALWAAIPGAGQIQVIQRSRRHVEVRYSREEALSPRQERALSGRVQGALGHPFNLVWIRQEHVDRQPNGKYQTFIDAS